MTSRIPLRFESAWATYINANGGTCTLTEVNQTARLQWAGGTHGFRIVGNMGRRNGKRYIEFTVRTITSGLLCLGIGSQNTGSYQYTSPTPPWVQAGGGEGGDIYSDVVYRSDGYIGVQIGGGHVITAASYVAGDVIGLAIDFTDGTLAWYKNGVSQGAGPSQFFPTVSVDGWVPFIATDGNSALDATVTVNGGENGFVHAAPSGYTAWGIGAEIDAAYSAMRANTGTLSTDNLTVFSGGSTPCTYGRSQGKYYFEATFAGGSIGDLYTGICDQRRWFTNTLDTHNPNVMGVLWGDAGSFGIYPFGHGVFQVRSGFHDMGAGAATALGDTLGFGVDLDLKALNVFIGGVLKYSFDFSSFSGAEAWYPWGSQTGIPQGMTFNYNPGSIPAGYLAWGVTDTPPIVTMNGKIATTLSGEPITVSLPVTSGAPTVWSMTGNPSWITIDPTTGTISVNPPLGINRGFEITVSATDGFTTGSALLLLYVGTQVTLPPIPNDGKPGPGVWPSQVRDHTRRIS